MDVQTIKRCFTQENGKFHFARRSSPVVPALIGAPSSFNTVFETAIDQVCRVSRHSWASESSDTSANSFFVFVDGWDDLIQLPMEVNGTVHVAQLAQFLKNQKASQFRKFLYAEDGTILISLGVYNTQSHLKGYPPERIALAQFLLTHLNFCRGILDFPIVEYTDTGWQPSATIVALIEAAYDKKVPYSSHDSETAEIILGNL